MDGLIRIIMVKYLCMDCIYEMCYNRNVINLFYFYFHNNTVAMKVPLTKFQWNHYSMNTHGFIGTLMLLLLKKFYVHKIKYAIILGVQFD